MTKYSNALTPKQKKLVEAITVNDSIGGNGQTKTMKALALEAGYSESMSTQPNRILKSPAIQKRLQRFLDGMESARLLHLAELNRPEKIRKTQARDNAYIMDILIKNGQLLSGRSTDNRAILVQISESIANKNAIVTAGDNLRSEAKHFD